MQTHADKNSKPRTLAVAHRLSKNNSDSSQFTDNRPQAIAQKKLQAMADASPRVKQLRVVQQMADNRAMNGNAATVMQLRLQKGAFNVVGEDHEESNERRNKEQLFSRFTVFSPNYWQEHQFKMKRTNGSSRLGDRAVLRAGEMVQLVFNYHDDYCHNFNLLLEQIPKEQPSITFKKLSKLLLAMAERRDTFLNIAAKELEREETVEKNDKWAGLKETLLGLTEMQLDVEEIEEASSYADLREKTGTLREANERFTQKVNRAFRLYSITQQGDLPEAVANMRDIYMHNSANFAQRFGRTGVWKIGQDHVDGIKQLDRDITYNLVSQEEFNEEYNEFEAERQEHIRNFE